MPSSSDADPATIVTDDESLLVGASLQKSVYGQLFALYRIGS
jgi:hypothetical protein